MNKDTISTPLVIALDYPKVALSLAASYVVMEVMHHTLIAGYIAPYLATTLGLSATVVSGISYGLLVGSVLGVSYLAYKAYKYFAKPATINSLAPLQTA